MIPFLFQTLACALGSTVITNSDLAALSKALQAGGVVTLAFDGTITLNESFAIATDTTLDASGHIVRLDGGNLVRHFLVTNRATLRLVNLTLANGRFRGRDGQVEAPNGETGRGGSILNAGGTLDLVNCRFINNQVRAGDAANLEVSTFNGGEAFGGAIFSADGVVLGTNCVFAGNQCTGGNGSFGPQVSFGAGGDAYGGALYLTNSRISLEAVGLTNNIAQGGEISPRKNGFGGGSALGGALAVELRPGSSGNVITRCVFADNRAYAGTRSAVDETRSFSDGGALFCGSGSLTIEQTLFSRNVALGGAGFGYPNSPPYGDGRGGAIFNRDGELIIQDSAIVLNQAIGRSLEIPWSPFYAGSAGTGWGGAIFNRGTLTVNNSTLAENAAIGGAGDAGGLAGSSYGGAVFNEGRLTLLSVTVGRNSATAGATLGYASQENPPEARGDALATVSATVTSTNSILSSGEGRTNVWGAIQDGGHNISSDDSANFSAASSKNNVDPLLGPLGNNGGLTPTMALLFGSPAIGAADATVCPPTDQRGVLRPVGSGCDIGAFEYSPRLTLKRLESGTVRLEYQFQAGQTNQLFGSTNLLDWVVLDTRVSDSNGSFEFEEANSLAAPRHFYKVEPVH